ncbi:MAG: c-type cytochrome [Planctomycetales bacterium]|nr:c-type cytochrome [Planctomycetales bacterium]
MNLCCRIRLLLAVAFVFACAPGMLGVPSAAAQSLEAELLAEGPAAIAKAAASEGDAARGAVLFYQSYLACTKCHTAGAGELPLGPDLTKLEGEVKPEHLIESVLEPSKVVKEPYRAVTVVTLDGEIAVGLKAAETKAALTLRDPSTGKASVFNKEDIDEVKTSEQSIMPVGLANQLASRQQFLDLARYLIEIVAGGPQRAAQLKPDPALYAAPPLPEYEAQIDHAGMITALDKKAFERGEAIYERVCSNCHGTHEREGSLPTSLKFASGKFKNGNDPYTMYQTITRGFGLMIPQVWMVPEQKYDVIHYIREAYLKEHNSSQYFAVDEKYLARLPQGDTRGPAPRKIEPWVTMDYGQSLINTYQVPGEALNFAYKGIAMRLDAGAGGVSRGRNFMIFDHDTLRMAAAWTGKGFINWQGIHFDGRHGAHPSIVGKVIAANPVGPGWANPETGSFDDPRLVGRDGRHYGPLPRNWAHYKGLYHHGQKRIVSYTVGETEVLEMPSVEVVDGAPVFTRTLNVGPRPEPLTLRVSDSPTPDAALAKVTGLAPGAEMFISGELGSAPKPARQVFAGGPGLALNGGTHIELARAEDFDMTTRDFTIAARIQTEDDGTIFAKTSAEPKWVPNGKTFFVRGGRLVFDIGWVGAVTSKREVADGKPHDVAITWDAKSARARLFIDGKLDGEKTLRPKAALENPVARIGYTSENFPDQGKSFRGRLEQVAFYASAIAGDELSRLAEKKHQEAHQLVGLWTRVDEKGESTPDDSGHGYDGKVVAGPAPPDLPSDSGLRWVATQNAPGLHLSTSKSGEWLLAIPAGKEPLQFALYLGECPREVLQDAKVLIARYQAAAEKNSDLDLSRYLGGGPAQFAQPVKTQLERGADDGPFAIDVLWAPENNPWLCRVRLTGFDFFADANRAAVAAWDGDVWLVDGLLDASGELTWRRIASGLFQPLGLKIVDETIYVTCRDQIVVLHDRNGDGETDFYENFNNDHQVTEHFHEFAMGLQTDAEGNFYYAKSARHALTALVPHHGTLLRVSKDGSRTDILANGFRAANGVCLNPDGSFIVTDQEGHWNPKNRINWVRPGGFYGNMFGYHDVTDSSDSAMEQPLCWITNAFDRSPSELLWVNSKRWGPLDGTLLNFSYGYGKIYVVPHEEIGGQMQGGMCALDIPQFPTGVMRGRFSPADGQLYTCGMFAWGSNQQTRQGGFYRVRYTGKPVHLPLALNAKQQGMEIRFSGELDATAAADPANYTVTVWSLQRTANYGSKHYDEHALEVKRASLSADSRTVLLSIPAIAPTWCMEIKYTLKSSDGAPIEGKIHNTIHRLGE